MTKRKGDERDRRRKKTGEPRLDPDQMSMESAARGMLEPEKREYEREYEGGRSRGKRVPLAKRGRARGGARESRKLEQQAEEAEKEERQQERRARQEDVLRQQKDKQRRPNRSPHQV